MKQKKLLVVDTDGINEMLITMRPLSVTNDVLATLSQGVSRSVMSIFSGEEVGGHPDRAVCMMAGKALIGFTVPLGHLMLRCPFGINDKKELHAAFDASLSTKMSLMWKVPEDMCLSLLVLCSASYPSIEKQFLTAISMADNNRKFYRLPLPNLYETCELCSGKFESGGRSYKECVKNAVTQFHNSDWNTDLLNRGDNDAPNSRRLFRFLPKGESEMQQMSDYGDWRRLATVISDSQLEMFHGN